VKNKKISGSYYTPKIIADFIIDFISDKVNGNKLSIFEPSVGDGVFIKSILEHPKFKNRIKKITAVEKDLEELNKVKSLVDNSILQTYNDDFLYFQKNHSLKFDLVIGNPPYIKKSLLTHEQIILCEEIHKIFPSLSSNKIKNIWPAFLIRSIKYVKENGILAFVLPSELLQVKFAGEIRELLLNEFERLEIFTFNELLFKDSKGQDTLLLICKRKSKNKGVYYCNIDKVSDLKAKNFTLVQNFTVKETKWTYHHLTSEEIEFLEKLRNKLNPIDHYCTSKVGIVTAANDYFIVNKNIIEDYSLKHFTEPIIQRGALINGSVVFTKEDFDDLVELSKPTFLINLKKLTDENITESISKYLTKGIELRVNLRYKTSLRDRWYEVPNIGLPPEALFFRRCDEYPKLIKNEANVLSTDSGYQVFMKERFNVESLIYSFYNSLTLAFAELNGRYYGGGVLELTPNEFKNLPIPYLNISNSEFNSYNLDFKNKSSIEEICDKNDATILKSIDHNLDSENIKKIYRIREKLYHRRIKY
jgi:adenine-specific DNA-methyltransferase